MDEVLSFLRFEPETPDANMDDRQSCLRFELHIMQ